MSGPRDTLREESCRCGAQQERGDTKEGGYSLGESMKATRVQIQPKGKGSSKRALVIGYFAGEGDALEALKELKKVHGVPQTSSDFAEPVVKSQDCPMMPPRRS